MTFYTTELLIKLITSFVATIGFAIVFQTNKRHLIIVGCAGFLGYLVYYTAIYFETSLFLAAFLSTFFVALFGELFARISHAPTLIFIVAGLIPIVPGADSYRSIKYLIQGESELASAKLIDTGAVAIGIASGIVCVSIIFGIIMDRIQKHRKKKQKIL